MLTADRAHESLAYDPETGVFSWRESRRGVRPGVCGRVSKAHGYHDICVDFRLYRAHRLAFLLMAGDLPPPDFDVDHINGNKTDNRWTNLRLATRSQNSINAKPRAHSASPAHGVTWDATRQKWRAQIRVDGRKVNLGRYAELSEAQRAYTSASARYHGAFAPAHVAAHGC